MKKVIGVVILVIIAILFGMVSPGQWLTDRSWELKGVYYKLRFRDVPPAKTFVAHPFNLKIDYVKNETTGELETYFLNTQRHEMLPVLEVAGTTQVGDLEHRLNGVREEAQQAIEKGGTNVLDKLKQLQDLF